MKTAQSIAVEAFKSDIRPLLGSAGIRSTVKIYGFTGPFASLPKDLDLVEFLEELFPEYVDS